MGSPTELFNLLRSRISRGPHRLVRFVKVAMVTINSSDANTANLNMGELQLNGLFGSNRSRTSQIPSSDHQRSILPACSQNIARRNCQAFVAQPVQQCECIESWFGDTACGD